MKAIYILLAAGIYEPQIAMSHKQATVNLWQQDVQLENLITMILYELEVPCDL